MSTTNFNQRDPFRFAPRMLQDIATFATIGREGLALGTRAADFVRWQREMKLFGLDDDDEFKRESARASQLRQFSEHQYNADFPLLHGLCVVAIWSVLEGFVSDVATGWLEGDKELWTRDPIAKLKGPLVEFAAASTQDQARMVVDALDRSLAASLKPGVGRFEAVLDSVGLGGGLDADARRVLLELSQVRHAFAHRAGLADERLLARCPWLGAGVGMPVTVTSAMLRAYSLAAQAYVLELNIRWFERRWSEHPEHSQTEYLRKITELRDEFLAELRSTPPTSIASGAP